MELHILTFIEQCSGLQGRRRCLAAGVLDIWHGTARHGTSLILTFDHFGRLLDLSLPIPSFQTTLNGFSQRIPPCCEQQPACDDS